MGVCLVHLWQGTVPREFTQSCTLLVTLQVIFSWNIIVWSRLKFQKKYLSLEDEFPCGFLNSYIKQLNSISQKSRWKPQPGSLALESGLKSFPFHVYLWNLCQGPDLISNLFRGYLNPPGMLATWVADCRVYMLQQWSLKESLWAKVLMCVCVCVCVLPGCTCFENEPHSEESSSKGPLYI